MRKTVLAALAAALSSLGLLAGTGTAQASGWKQFPLYQHQDWCVTGPGTVFNGSTAFLYKCYPGHSNQLWNVQASGYAAGYWQIEYGIRDGSGHLMCLDIPGDSSQRGLQLDIFQCNSTAAQAWGQGTNFGGLLWYNYNGLFIADAAYHLVNGNAIETWTYSLGAGYELWAGP